MPLSVQNASNSKVWRCLSIFLAQNVGQRTVWRILEPLERYYAKIYHYHRPNSPIVINVTHFQLLTLLWRVVVQRYHLW